YNLFAHIAKEIWKNVDLGLISQARAGQAKLNSAIQELTSLGLYQALKEIISISGIDTGCCLPPFSPLSQEQKEKADALGRKYVDMKLIGL
ncbi:MAG TPA: dihydrodipicolinate synthase family protein, partial [Rectinema sp.]|nr:dihydrodipicolinate synthase family protein [Rectinema sp.]